MNQTSNQKLNDKTWARWSALFVVAFTMMAAYYVNDIMAPLKSMLEGELHWTSGEFGFFTEKAGGGRVELTAGDVSIRRAD